MAPVRLGVACAVIDDDGRVLLSRRGDLNVWNLPGGRLDAGEALAAAVAREVREETGIIAHIERPVGLHYLAGWNRLNVLYAGWPLGGALQPRTAESRANAFFDVAHLPDGVLWEWIVFDALADIRPLPRIIETPTDELLRIKNRLRWRWVQNLLRGRPEPRYPRFEVGAVGVIWDMAHRSVLTLRGTQGQSLPRVGCDGRRAPWEQLRGHMRRVLPAPVTLCWVGLGQDSLAGRFDFVFAAAVEEVELSAGADWVTARSAALAGIDAQYVEGIHPGFAEAPVWTVDISGVSGG